MFLLDLLFKFILFIVLALLDMLGWKRASKWLDDMIGHGPRDEKPVV